MVQVGIIGAGYIGGALASILVKAGHTVLIANSRGPATLGEVAAKTGATPVTAHEAAQAKDVVVLTIPLKNISDLPKDLFAKTAASVPVIDTNNYYPLLRDGTIPEIDEGLLDAQWVERQIGHPVVKVFNNIHYVKLETAGRPRGAPGRIALPVAGDSEPVKRVVLELVEELGFDAVDAGPISETWRFEPGTAAYGTDLEKPALLSALAETDLSKRGEARLKAVEQARAWYASTHS